MKPPEDDTKDPQDPAEHASDAASRTNTDAASARPTGKQTALLRSKEIEAEAKIREKEIDADIRKQELALESKKLDVNDHDKARDDRRSTLKTVLLWITGITGTVGALVLLGLALYYNRAFVFSGFGIEASTQDANTPAKSGDDPQPKVPTEDSKPE